MNPILYTIDQNGAVKQHSITVPFSNAVPIGAKYASNGTLLIQFGKQIDQNHITSVGDFFALVEVNSGQTIESYTAESDSDGLFGCFIPTTGFEFLNHRSNGAWNIRFDSK